MSDSTLQADFQITGRGTVYAVEAITDAAKARLAEIVEENEIPSYMLLGRHGIAVEWRFVGTWADNLGGEGFNVEII